VDINGAKHIQYDLLVHIGFACFSDDFDAENILYLPEKAELNIENVLHSLEKIDFENQQTLILFE
jgi:diphthamide biosynthesis enzyme Dph1/Dph2-like protein